ncbi:hypothetical protein [Arthrobacter bambusae]|uniref:hypothetical protein n=1 Tax=Arthrobacter bambusae TaxID=1338426 RepID=UPI002787E4D5|nr:hypothetical protein [Arthrobacter bambusae]MDQ0031138.1 hypothetical protein [Arthrobacter bambusae]MDQ0099361.1 hypothetical protein [Arthrobacter bambusae]
MGWARALTVLTTRSAIPAVVLCGVLASGTMSSCEYTYEDGRAPVSSPPSAVVVEPALPRDPPLSQTVTGDALKAWAQDVLPDLNGLSFHSSFGLLSAGKPRDEETTQLPGGTYAVTMACRGGATSAEFTVREGGEVRVEVMLRCGSTRVKVLQLKTDAVLGITITANAPANFAYRVSRI